MTARSYFTATSEQRAEYRRRFFTAVMFYTLLIAIPAFCARNPDGGFHLAKVRGMTGLLAAFLPAAILALPAALSRGIKIGINIILSFLLICDLWMFFILGTHFSEKILMLMLATNSGEASEFLDTYLLTLPSIGVILGSICGIDLLNSLTGVILSRGKPGRLRSVSYHNVRIEESGFIHRAGPVCFALALLLSGAANYIGLFSPYLRSQMGFTLIEQIWFVVSTYRIHRPDIAQLESVHSSLIIPDPALSRRGENSVESPAEIIWIIGESFNKHHSSLYGYPLPTTPTLQEELEKGNLILFRNAVTPSAATDEVMRIILSPHMEGDSLRWEQTPLLPALFRMSGWRVSYHDNQTTLLHGDEKWDIGNAYYLNSPIISNACFDYRNSKLFPYDGEMVENELTFRARPDSLHKALSIFHLMGQHMDASMRYPADFDKFGINDYTYRKDLDDEQRSVVAAYDNATLYNDRVVGRVIKDLSEDDDAILIYHSDHGEEVHDFRRQYGRTLEPRNPQIDRNIYEIPLIIYTTPTFRRRHPELTERLSRDAERPFSTDSLALYLLRLSGIRLKTPLTRNVKARDADVPRIGTCRSRSLAG